MSTIFLLMSNPQSYCQQQQKVRNYTQGEVGMRYRYRDSNRNKGNSQNEGPEHDSCRKVKKKKIQKT